MFTNDYLWRICKETFVGFILALLSINFPEESEGADEEYFQDTRCSEKNWKQRLSRLYGHGVHCEHESCIKMLFRTRRKLHELCMPIRL
jgi:hypothetical protein